MRFMHSIVHFGLSIPRGKNITADLVAAMKKVRYLEQD
jgi:hypothetical protein